MLQVAVLEDEQESRVQIKRCLERYQAENHAEWDMDYFSSGAELLFSGASGYDILLMDIEMPEMNGIDATIEAMKMKPNLKIIVLSMYGDEQYYYKMIDAGAKGFLLKNSGIDKVVTAIQKVAEGESFFSEELLVNILNNMRDNKSETPETVDNDISERELEILYHVCKGLSNQEIADELFISKRTVDKHRANLLSKTGCRNTAALVMYAIKNNIIEI